MNFSKKTALALFLCMSFNASIIKAEEIDTIFSKVKEYMGQQNFTKALEELSWAKQEIEKKNSEKLQSFFADDVAGFKGDKAQINSALGFTSIEKNYKSADKGSLKVTLTGGSSAAGGGLGGLAQIGKMAAMFGNQAGMETVRIQGRTATIEKDQNSKGSSISVFLDSGSVLKVDSNTSKDTEMLKAFIEALKVEELDKYLKG